MQVEQNALYVEATNPFRSGEERQALFEQLEASNPQIQAPQDFSKFLTTNSEKTAQDLNAQTQEAQTQEAQTPQDGYIEPDKYEGTRYQKYRNTGVDYFDNKAHLGLYDAYIAKKLGLNVSWNFHKIDVKSDNTNRNTNLTSSLNNITESIARAKNLIGSAIGLNEYDDSLKQKVKTAIETSPLKAFINLDAKKPALAGAYRENYGRSLGMAGKNGTLSKDAHERLDKQLGTEVTLDNVRAGQTLGIALNQNINAIEENIKNLRYNGAHQGLIYEQEQSLNYFKRVRALLENNGKIESNEQAKALALGILSLR